MATVAGHRLLRKDSCENVEKAVCLRYAFDMPLICLRCAFGVCRWRLVLIQATDAAHVFRVLVFGTRVQQSLFG